MTKPNNDTVRQIYCEFDAKCAQAVYKYSSSRDYETHTLIPSIALKEEMKAAFESLLEEAKKLPEPDPVFSLLRSHFIEFLTGRISAVETNFQHLARFMSGQTWVLDFNSRQDSRPAQERLAVLSARLSQTDALWEGIKALFPDSQSDKIQEVARACKILRVIACNVKTNIPKYYHELDSRAQADLAVKLDEIVSRAAAWEKEALYAAESKTPAEHGSDSVTKPVNPERYRRILENELGVSLEELLDWHEREMASTREQLLDTARDLGVRPVKSLADVFAILDEHAGPCDTVEEMFSRMKGYVETAKKATLDGYVKLPEEHCVVSPTPEQTRDSYPWGGYGGGCFRRRPLVGEVFLNETNYKAVTDGWLKMMAIHECYPGHHVQFVRTTMDPLPETVKIGSRYIPLMEGTAHRSEKLMEHIFPDRFFPLFVRLRRHHTAVRIKADLWLHYFGKPVDDAVKLYMQELGFDRTSARGQVLYQELNPGYMTCYYYGMKKIGDLQAKFKYGDKEFTEILFSVGRLSLANFERFLELSDEDKVRFQTQFAGPVR